MTLSRKHGSARDGETGFGDASAACAKLLAYCRANRWMGHDPYDALNSPWVTRLPGLNVKFCRLALTQALKRSPLDVRRLLSVPRTENPKAIALFLMASLRLADLEVPEADGLASTLADRLEALRSRDVRPWCWGYSFPWQTGTVLIERGMPNLVCTVFVAEALLDAYERRGERRYLEMAASAADYIVSRLYWTDGATVAAFGYPLSSVRVPIHNANLLGAALLCRVARLSGDGKLLAPALRVARYSAGRQQSDGSWWYGEGRAQRWVDNFHTGYNLGALRAIGEHAGTTEFEGSLRRGFAFYRDHFFAPGGVARYYHDRTYPIDVHAVAQSIITLVTLQDLEPGPEENLRLASSVLRWTMKHMWDRRGFFHYRVLRLARIKISYMRWSQAWMLLALSTWLAGRGSASVNAEARTFGVSA